MANRPTNDRTWAESAKPEDVSEPSAERSSGFLKGERFDHDQFNWLEREIFRWIDYFDEKFQRADEAINIVESVVVNDNGVFNWSSDSDTGIVNLFFKNSGGDGDSLFSAGILQAVTRVLTNVIRSTNGSEIDVEDNGGNSGQGSFKALNTVKAFARVSFDAGNTEYNFTNFFGFDDTASSPTRNSTGRISMVLSEAAPSINDIVIIAMTENTDYNASGVAAVDNNVTITIQKTDDLAPKDDDFFVMVMY